MPVALFNGSYLSRKPTGIGIVARALGPPSHGRRGHLQRLLWTQKQLPQLLRVIHVQFRWRLTGRWRCNG